jgi:cysteine-rich repeat protein
MRATLLLLGSALVVGCVDPSLVPCGDLLCPADSLCVAERCATQLQVDACAPLADGDMCEAGAAPGLCDRGICIASVCGNEIVDLGEGCDDGNLESGDGCRGDCQKLEVCGDAIADTGEGCDDGNENTVDGCDQCVLTTWQARAVIGRAVPGLETSFTMEGIATDRDGNVYIADYDNHRIRRLDPDGQMTTIAGTGVDGFSGDGGPALAAQLYRPRDVAVDGLGNVYIADGFRVRRVDPTGIITTVPGLGSVGAVAVDGIGTLFVAVGNGISKVDTNGTITTLATGLSPFDIALDAAGNVYVANYSTHRILRVDPTGAVTTVAGTTSGYSGDDGPATAAQLSYPNGVALDAAGNLYISEWGNDRIRRVAATGIITTLAGTTAGFAGDGGQAAVAQLAGPEGVAVGADGTVYVADGGNYRLRAIAPTGVITTVAGNGSPFATADAPATSVSIPYPYAVAADSAGSLYISDVDSSSILRVDPSGVLTTVVGIAGGGFGGDGGDARQALLSAPWGISIDPAGNLLIADSANDRIRRVDTNGIITTIAGNGTRGFGGDGGLATSAALNIPYAVAGDSDGNVYIADSSNHRVRKVDANGIITTFAGTGVDATSGDGGPAISAGLQDPTGIAVDAQGRVYIVDLDSNRVRRVDTDGTISTVAGSTQGFSGDEGPATSAQLSRPRGITLDEQGVLYIADSLNGRIRRVGADGVITTVAGSSASTALGDGAVATQAGLYFPTSVAVRQGIIYIADSDDLRVRKVDATQIITTVAGRIDPEGTGPVLQGRLGDPQALVVTSAFTLFAGGTHGVVQALRTGGTILEVVAGRYPQSTPTADLARFRDWTFGAVPGVTADAAGSRIFFTEGNRVHVVTVTNPSSTASWTIATLANTANTAGHADGAAATAGFRSPGGLYFDEAAQHLYVADTGNHAIRRIDLAGGLAAATVTTIAGVLATRGFFGDGGEATAALLYQPQALTRCSNGDLFIADTGNHRVRRIASGTGIITTVLGDGVGASSGEGTPASTFPVNAPQGLACDPTGNLFITSTTTVRLLPSDASGVVDGTRSVQTIYGAQPRTTFPANTTACLSGIAVINATTVQLTDACSGLLVELVRTPQ